VEAPGDLAVRVVLDANVLIADAIASGMCRRVVRHCLATHELVLSDHILEEVRRTLLRKFELSTEFTDTAVSLLRGRSLVVEPATVDPRVCRDPKDLPVLGTAVAGAAACLVTGDKDLLVLRSFRGVTILGPGEFRDFEAEGA
jgi:putative PIN family toxin of toxin-antitoxin system